ncbi:MAG: Calx-beta domain-containing protein [Chloroflexota bacterium]
MTVSNEAELQEAIDCFAAENAAGTYTINLANSINLNASLPGIENTNAGTILEINGGGFVLDGQDTAGLRPLAVFTGTTASLVNLTITGGNIDSIADVSRNRTSGGAIANYGVLTLDGITVTGNTSEDWGGGIFSELNATLTIRNSTIEDNSAGEDGGGIQNFGDLTIEESAIKSNSAVRFSGGIGVNAPDKLIQISNSHIISNTSGNDGGGIYNRYATAIISSSVITGNVSNNNRGGGIFNNRETAVMTVINTTIENNFAKISGGGIHNNVSAMLFISNSSISNNSVDVPNLETEGGGGLRNDGGDVVVENSTFSGNVATTGVSNVDGTMRLTHVTVADTSHGIAGTIVGVKNFSPTSVDTASQMWIYNSALADNPTDCQIETGSVLEASVGNLIEADSLGLEACSNNDALNVDAQLLPLADNGGETKTHNIEGTSPLIDAADATICAGLNGGAFDQRGITRPPGECDIGAYESTIEISIDDVSITESNDGTQNMVFTVTRNKNDEAFTLTANTQDGTAMAESDYVALNDQTVSFSAGGALTQQVTVVINGDIEFEGDETFSVVLSDSTAGFIVDETGVGTIEENQTVQLTVTAAASVVEGDNGTTPYIFTLELDTTVGGSFMVTYLTQPGTATEDATGDYQQATGTITMAGTGGPGGAETITVNVLGDETPEPNETFSLEITSISDASVGAAPLLTEAVIQNDDAPEVSFQSATYAVSPAGDALITLELEIPATEMSSVVVTSADGTATAGSDYTAVNETVTFNEGESTKTVTIPIAANTGGEDDETFSLSLSNYTNLNPGTTTTTQITIESKASIYLPLIVK